MRNHRLRQFVDRRLLFHSPRSASREAATSLQWKRWNENVGVYGMRSLVIKVARGAPATLWEARDRTFTGRLLRGPYWKPSWPRAMCLPRQP